MRTTVLVVDDEPMVGNALARMLSNDFDVDTANSGHEALEKLDRKAYEVIVSDLVMEGMSGAELLSRAAASHPETLRILMTADIELVKFQSSIAEANICRLLQKPFRTTELITTIRDAVRAEPNTVCYSAGTV